MEKADEEKAWRKVEYGKKFAHAFRGLQVFWKTTENSHLAIYLIAILAVVVLGFYFCVSGLEWIALVFAIALVLISEMFNTAIEIDIDLTSPEYHPYARDTKDVAAGAVLLASFLATIIGLIIFLPKIILYANI